MIVIVTSFKHLWYIFCRKDRKKLKKDRSNTFKEKFKSIKVKKREKESKEKAKDKEKEEKKEKKEKKKHKRSLSAGASLTATNVQSPPPSMASFGLHLLYKIFSYS